MSDNDEESDGGLRYVELGCLLAVIIGVVLTILALLGPAIANVFNIGLPGAY